MRPVRRRSYISSTVENPDTYTQLNVGLGLSIFMGHASFSFLICQLIHILAATFQFFQPLIIRETAENTKFLLLKTTISMDPDQKIV